MNLKGLSVEDAKRKLEYYCSYQDRCYKEVITKLKTLGMLQTAVDHILDHLVAHDFLNEERFAKSFARGKHRIKGWGKRRIERELKLREDRKSTRLNSSHVRISYAVFCLKKKT